MLVDLANTIEMDLIIEGVENEEQFNILLDMGYRQFQGYYFYKPMNFQSFIALLE